MLEELFETIENIQFSVMANLASGLSVFVKILTKDPSVIKLSEKMTDDQSRQTVFDRAVSLINSPSDLSVEHPSDVAVATYFFLLKHDNQLSASLCQEINQSKGNWWWTKEIISSCL
jgi:hypothetical protein